MDTFGFIVHPIDSKRDISRKYPLLGRIATDWMIKHISPLFPPVFLSEIQGIRSKDNNKEVRGFLLACPLSPKHFIELPVRTVYKKIIHTCRRAEQLGSKIVGLGAFTSVVGDGGITIASELDIPVTTGDAYTIGITIQTALYAANRMNLSMNESSAAVVGATGAIGRTCAHMLSREVSELYLVGRDRQRLAYLQDELSDEARARIHISTNLNVLTNANLILSVTNSSKPVILSEHLSAGSIVCDVARPRDVSPTVLATRPDVLIVDGGIVDVPGKVDFHFDFGLPPGKAYACMAETIALTLEGRFESYTLGKHISPTKVDEISSIARRHGFQLSGIRSFKNPVTDEKIDSIRMYANKNRRHIYLMGG